MPDSTASAEVRPFGAGTEVVVQGKANFRGHPLHLIFVSFPIAFWTGAVFTDIGGALVRDAFWFRMSVTLLAMGTFVAALATVFGFVDYYTVAMTPPARRLALRHMWASLGTLAAFALASLLRLRDDAAPLGIAVTALAAVLLLVAGYFGSELANRFGVGFLERPPRA